MPRARQRKATTDLLAEWGATLARLRGDQTQEDVAARAGVSRQWLSEVEGGLLDPTLTRLAGVLAELGTALRPISERPDPQTAIAEALETDPDLTRDWRDVVWTVYTRAKHHKLRRDGRRMPRRRREDRFLLI